MADTSTSFLALTKPEVGASADSWGDKLNADLDAIDAAVKALAETPHYAAASGVDAIDVTLDPAPSAYVAGLQVRFRAAGPNTVSPTLNVGGLGAKAIKYPDGAAIAAGGLAGGVIYTVDYNGTDFVIAGIAPASPAETLAGTDAVKALTAAGVFANAALGANGYYRLPGGFAIQWGATSSAITTESDHAVSFPAAFATACRAAGAMANNPAGSSGNDGFAQLKSMSTTGAVFRMQDVGGSLAGVTWWAFGH